MDSSIDRNGLLKLDEPEQVFDEFAVEARSQRYDMLLERIAAILSVEKSAFLAENDSKISSKPQSSAREKQNIRSTLLEIIMTFSKLSDESSRQKCLDFLKREAARWEKDRMSSL